jgi:hypothetical protein
VTDVEAVLLYAIAQDGDNYRFGVEVNLDNRNPNEFDCSELVEWACHRARVSPPVPDGSWLQARHCHQHGGDAATVAEAVETRGALLFRFSDDPFTATQRPSTAHVAWSLGNGKTIEAAGTKWGVGSLSADPDRRHWTYAARIPGVDYTKQPPEMRARMSMLDGAPSIDDEEDDVLKVIFFKGPDGAVHPYIVDGVVGKHLSPGALEIHRFLQTFTVSSPEEGLDKRFQDGVALLDGPLHNIP